MKIRGLVVGSILSIVFFVIIKSVISELNIFIKNTEYVATLSFFLTIIFLFHKKYNLALITYGILVIILMNFRSKEDAIYNFDISYLKAWIKLLFSNKIVFINLAGNGVLFIPIFILFYRLKINIYMALIYTIFIIVLFELLQVITKRGIFDIADIALNISGVAIMFLVMYFYGVLYEKRQEKEEKR